MARLWWAGLVLAAIGPAATRAADPPKADAKPADTVAARFAAVRDEYDAANRAASKAAERGKSDFESWKIYSKTMPSVADYSKRMVDLAATDPKDQGARDALLWVLDKPGMSAAGTYADEYVRAALLLLRHHADDPEVARLGLQIDNIGSFGRDLFLEGLYVRAKNREAKALARMALAQYLMTKLVYAERGRNDVAAGRPVAEEAKVQTYGDDGKLGERPYVIPPEDRAYDFQSRQLDPDALRTQARRLFEEVTRDDGDIPYLTSRSKALEALLKQPNPTWQGEPLKAEDRRLIEKRLARRQTLAEVAAAKLDEMDNLVAGKPAPPIEGVGMDGKPLKLSDYRGKVVVLVFWGTWCGPCMQAVPHERELAARLKDKPFALLGVDCDGDQDAARKVMRREGITWPNWNDGDPGEGPIVKRYHVRGFPSTYVLDAHGTIRHVGPTGKGLDKAVDDLLAATPGDGTPK